MSRRPISREEYDGLFRDKKRKNALKSALNTRKFEIELYWKRATYFWAFIAASFAGYFAIISSDNIDNYRILTILIAFIGFCFSLGWYFVNRGSKYWQENWEKHVDFLETDEQGPLFSVHLIPKDKRFHLNGYHKYSVSKTNQNLSLIITVIWCLIFVCSVLFTLRRTDEWERCLKDIGQHMSVCCIVFTSIAVLVLTYLLLRKFSLSESHKEQPSLNADDMFSVPNPK
jgi:uncharacterized membrane protein